MVRVENSLAIAVDYAVYKLLAEFTIPHPNFVFCFMGWVRAVCLQSALARRMGRLCSGVGFDWDNGMRSALKSLCIKALHMHPKQNH